MSTRNNSIQQVSTSAPVGAQVGDKWFDPNTNRQYQLLPVNGTTVQWVEVPTSANAYGAVTASPGSWTALQSFLGTSDSLGLALNNAAERISFFGIGASGTIDYNITNQSILYYIGNAGSNWAINFRGSEGVSLNSIMAIGQSVTAVFLANQSATPYFNNAVRVDGTTYTPAWQGGAAPTSGTANGTDLYSYTLVKTNEFSFAVFASRTVHSKPVFVNNPPGVESVGLYTFNSAITFTPGGTTGRDGPSLEAARSGLTGTGVDAWKTNTSFFNVTDGIQYWTVPRTATYTIEAWGAQGGNAGSQQGGRGARIKGDFPLTEGEIIRILVGQQGQSGPHTQDSQPMGAGGGGTYVVRTPYNTTGSILVVAGGGGGAAQNSYSNAAGNHASATNNGTTTGAGAAGTGGNGGGGGDGSGSGPGGAGFTGNGLVDPLSGNSAGDNSKSFVNGGRGGRKSLSWGGSEIFGGFGGGGGGGGLACGGGGGYSGGGGGTWSSPQQGGGGGSFNSAPSGAVNEAGNTGGATLSGAGRVVITPVETAPAGGGGGGLYSFIDATFTSGAVAGRSGPSIAQARTGLTGTGVDSWKGNTAFFDVLNGIQLWTVPETATYRIEAAGAGAFTYRQGGYGARIRGTFELTQGEIIRILVGQEPDPAGVGSSGGAAGGTFVTKSPHNTNGSILLIAGGGGGGHANGLQSNSNGNASSPNGRPGTGSGGSPGTSGNGGAGQDAGGGGGFFTNGGNGGSGVGGFAYVNGGFGSNETSGQDGGFGGGGSSGSSHGAGGGGYSGGAGTGGFPWHGGGGGSYSNGLVTDNQLDQHRPGPGYVSITKL
jgi:hypothetical protein